MLSEVFFLAVATAVLVGIPTVGMSRQSVHDDVDSRSLWLGVMLVASVVVPVLGPVLVWLSYATLFVNRNPTPA
jgi:predicted PurR-regulated permease PerM